MKKKLLVLAPLMALVLTGCFSRTPTNRKKRSSSTTTAQTSTTGGSVTSGGSSGTTGGSSGGTSGGTSGTSGTSGSSGTSGTSEVPPVPTEVTVEEAYNAAVTAGSGGTSEALTFSGTVIATLGDQYYVQDGSYAMYCRPMSTQAVAGIAVNKRVQTTAKVGTYNGLVETINNGYVSGTVTGDATAPAPTTVTSLEQLSALKHNVAVNVEVTLASKPSGTWSASNYVRPTVKIGSDTTAITITLEKGTAYKDEFGTIYNNAAVGDKLTLTNVIRSQYNNNAQLTFVDQSTMSKNSVTPTSIEITSGSTVTVGNTLNLTASVGPTGAPQDVVWGIESGNEYATLSGNVLTGTAAGTVVVRATAKTVSSVTTTKSITVNPQVLTSLAFTAEEYNFEGGSEENMLNRITFAPSTAEKNLSFSIKESVESSITAAGVLTVDADDTSFHVIVSDSVSGLSDECLVTVVASVVHVTGVAVSPTQQELDIDDVLNLTVTVSPEDATDKTFTLISSNPTVVEVTGTSSVTARAAGNASVTVTTTDGSFQASCAIVVHAPAPVETIFYTLEQTEHGTNNTYAGECDVTVSGITWNINGNSQQTPWRFGGKSLSGVDRTLYSKTAMDANITKVVMNNFNDSGSITVNSITLIVSSAANGGGTVYSTLSGTYTKGGNYTFTRPTSVEWGSAYFKFVFNVTVSGSSNKYMTVETVDFYSMQ